MQGFRGVEEALGHSFQVSKPLAQNLLCHLGDPVTGAQAHALIALLARYNQDLSLTILAEVRFLQFASWVWVSHLSSSLHSFWTAPAVVCQSMQSLLVTFVL